VTILNSNTGNSGQRSDYQKVRFGLTSALLSDGYYSFDYGPVHITVIDQETDYLPGSQQYNWIVNDLSATDKLWKIAVFHKPGWSAGGGHSNSKNVQNYLQPLFEKYGVSFAICGHNHYYSRAVINGVQHITTGGGGMILTDCKKSAETLKKMSYDGREPDKPWREQNISSMGYHYYMTMSSPPYNQINDIIASMPAMKGRIKSSHIIYYTE